MARSRSTSRDLVPLGVGLAVALAAGALLAVPAGAHVNHASVDAQISADGTVVVETVFAADAAWLAIRTDDGGEPGAVLGARLIGDSGFRTDVTVQLSDGWSDGAAKRPVWAALHRPDGDDTFDPSDDIAIESFGSLAGERFSLAADDRPAVVTARQFGPQRAENGTVRVRRVALPADGHLVIHGDDDGPGRVVGNRSLSAGIHRNVTVAVEPAAVAGEGVTPLWAVAYGDGGDGSFDEADEPVRVGDEVVGTRFGVRGGPDGTATGDAPPTESGEPVVTATPTHTPTTTDDDTSTGDATGETGPGPGAAGVIAAVLALGAIARWRRG